MLRSRALVRIAAVAIFALLVTSLGAAPADGQQQRPDERTDSRVSEADRRGALGLRGCAKKGQRTLDYTLDVANDDGQGSLSGSISDVQDGEYSEQLAEAGYGLANVRLNSSVGYQGVWGLFGLKGELVAAAIAVAYYNDDDDAAAGLFNRFRMTYSQEFTLNWNGVLDLEYFYSLTRFEGGSPPVLGNNPQLRIYDSAGSVVAAPVIVTSGGPTSFVYETLPSIPLAAGDYRMELALDGGRYILPGTWMGAYSVYSYVGVDGSTLTPSIPSTPGIGLQWNVNCGRIIEWDADPVPIGDNPPKN